MATVFGIITAATMTAIVLTGREALFRLPLAPLERWSLALAGATIGATGLTVRFLGL